ncbi:hypothetical protein [Nocardia terpenica]|uniref:Cytochrome P450 n=1 Tax=Nocardia terpenica TaxID=455432 RepID=A0A6G9Z846_9NOCA|nr:hypothetical protein [Nocardia terpenica]QIS21624.1 hypothetical protein F6W96_28090 [Nocardia terpenica]
MPNILGGTGSRRLRSVDPPPAGRSVPAASPPEVAAFHALTAGPRLPRPPLGPLAGVLPGAPQLARIFLARISAAHDGAPVRIPTPGGPMIMACTVDSADELARAVLEGDPDSLKAAVSADGRRRFLHSCPPQGQNWTRSRAHIRQVAAATAEQLLGHRRLDGRVDRQNVVLVGGEMCRRLVLGDQAAIDALLQRDIRALHEAPLTSLREAQQRLLRRIEPYLERPEAGTVAASVAAGLDQPEACRVVAHMLVSLTGSLRRCIRAMALLAVTQGDPAAAVAESRRCWPGWSHVVYVAGAPFEWRGYEFACGESILVPAAWLLRDERVFGEPDAYAPDRDDRRRAGSFMAARVCGGTTQCPADDMVSETLTVFLAAVTELSVPILLLPRNLSGDCLPAELDAGGVRVRYADRGRLSVQRSSDMLMFETGSVEDLVFLGDTTGRYGELAAASAVRLREHAHRLRDCADGADLAGDRFRDIRARLFVQAQRCACAAEEVEAVGALLRAAGGAP